MSMGDAALTVTLGTVGGAILGASTLPFYEDSGKHTKNIFYGAAFGAVVGVLIAAYSGVQEGSDMEEEEARIEKRRRDLEFALKSEQRFRPEASSALQSRAALPEGTPMVWQSLATVHF